MACVIAVYNIKGGVGKTTTAVNLAFEASRHGGRTLLWDMDSQGAASFYLRVKPKVKGHLKGILNKQRSLQDSIKESDYPNLHILPADWTFRLLDLAVADAKKPEDFIAQVLKPLQDEYDWIIVDCPPNLTPAIDSLLRASDLLLVPLIPTILSVRTLKQLLRYVRKDKQLRKMPVRGFFNMMDVRKTLHRDMYQAYCETKDTIILKCMVPYLSVVERMGVERAPVAEFAGRTAAASGFRSLWREVEGIFPAQRSAIESYK